MRLPVLLATTVLLGVGPSALADPKITEYKFPEGRFIVKLPGKQPKPDNKKLAVGSTGLAIPVTTYRVEGSNSTILAVTFADYPETFRDVSPKTILDGVRDGLKGKDGTVAKDEVVTLGKDTDKVEGREFHIVAGSKTAVRVRVYLVETRLYQVMVTGTKDTVNTKSATEFLDSFQLMK